MRTQAKDCTHSQPETPCVGICSTGIGDSVCRGCKRFNHEVINWNSYSPEQKQNVLERLDRLLIQVSSDKLKITDEQPLKEYLVQEGVKISASRALLVAIVGLLRQSPEGASKMPGIELKAGLDQRDLIEMSNRIEQDFYALSCAFYDANFVRAYQAQSSSQKRRS